MAVLTSGGDAPGMNAAIRSVVRTGLNRGWDVLGVRRGFEGLIQGRVEPMHARDVGNILQLAGTFLESSRCPAFRTETGRKNAVETIEDQGIDGLVVIGGNGTQRGAHALSERGIPVIGVASTIDNDLYGSDITIGVDTALNVALESIDRLRVTASSHRRATLVEVMGRRCGYLALKAGVTGGAEAIVIPEKELPPETVASRIRDAHDRGKTHALVVVAEGANNNADDLRRYLVEDQPDLGYKLRTTILGFVQRGGAPTAFDRLLGTRLGARATRLLDEGRKGLLVGWKRGEVNTIPLKVAAQKTKQLDTRLLELARVLAQ